MSLLLSRSHTASRQTFKQVIPLIVNRSFTVDASPLASRISCRSANDPLRFSKNPASGPAKHARALQLRRPLSSTANRWKEEWPKVSVTQPEDAQSSVEDPLIAQADIPDIPNAATADRPKPLPPAVSEKASIPSEPTVKHVRDEDLPSRRAALRSKLTKWFNTKMEELIPKLLLASQRINTFTGTDYSAIEELRREIKEQEQLVRARHSAVTKAKEALEEAHGQRGASQKEVVGLLERKHSWSSADLERYMNLIRSEHQNDRAVQEAKDTVNATEKALEESRARLETRERRQYHEEQIWSDTIRRNSTWITFGLMGVNFLLLLLNLVVFEPYRRRKIVREIKAALDEKSISGSTVNSAPASAAAVAAPAIIESVLPTVKETVSPVAAEPSSNVPLVADETASPAATVIATLPEVLEPSAERPASAQDTSPIPESPNPELPGISEELDNATSTIPGKSRSPPQVGDLWTIEGLKAYTADLFSERQMTMRMLDVTTIAVESAVAGAAFVALLIVMLRPNP